MTRACNALSCWGWLFTAWWDDDAKTQLENAMPQTHPTCPICFVAVLCFTNLRLWFYHWEQPLKHLANLWFSPQYVEPSG